MNVLKVLACIPFFLFMFFMFSYIVTPYKPNLNFKEVMCNGMTAILIIVLIFSIILLFFWGIGGIK